MPSTLRVSNDWARVLFPIPSPERTLFSDEPLGAVGDAHGCVSCDRAHLGITIHRPRLAHRSIITINKSNTGTGRPSEALLRVVLVRKRREETWLLGPRIAHEQ